MKLIVFCTCICLCQLAFSQDFTSYRTGAAESTDAEPEYGVMLAGGATDHDVAMQWFLQKANGGDVLVIRTSGSDGYNDYFYTDLGVDINSVETIVFHSADAAYDDYVIQRIEEAEGIWIAGGDQSTYVDFWRDSPVGSALNNYILVKRGVIGGTSAGMAVLGDHYFSASNGTVYSDETLEDPYNQYVTLGSDDFLSVPELQNTITDTHFDDPDRSGRLLTFMGRLLQDLNLPYVRGIACDEYTAVCFDDSGLARCYGYWPEYEDYVYFLTSNCELDHAGPELCESQEHLTWDQGGTAVKAYKVNADEFGNSNFDLSTWQNGNGGEWYNWSVSDAELAMSTGPAPQCIFNTLSEPVTTAVSIYPNPTKGKIMLKGLPHLQEVEIYSLQGTPVGKFTVDNGELIVESLAPGLYIIELEGMTFRLIKE